MEKHLPMHDTLPVVVARVGVLARVSYHLGKDHAYGLCRGVDVSWPSHDGGRNPSRSFRLNPEVFRRCHPETLARAVEIRCSRGEGYQGGHLCPVLESNLRLTHLLPSGKGVKLDSDYSGSAPSSQIFAFFPRCEVLFILGRTWCWW